MPGDDWQKLANLRALLAYMFTRPGKKLLFMGTELAPPTEWNHDVSLDWHLPTSRDRARVRCSSCAASAALYQRAAAALARRPELGGFAWIDVADRENSVLSYVRRAGDEHVVVVLNLTPIPREDYRIGVPACGDVRAAPLERRCGVGRQRLSDP